MTDVMSVLGGRTLPFKQMTVLPGQALREGDDLQKGGVKMDANKTRMDLLPASLLWGVASILTFGAIKYSDRNWELGMKWSRPFGAIMRHMWAWWRGEKNDPETGMPHLWHAATNVAFLIEYEEKNKGEDDRPK